MIPGRDIYNTIHGTSGQRFLALYGCRTTFSVLSDPEHGRAHYAPRDILVVNPGEDFDWDRHSGAFDDIDSLRCTGFTIKSKLHLQHWIGRGSVVGAWPSADAQPPRIDIEMPPGISAAEGGTRAELAFGHNWHSVNGRFGCIVEQATVLRISFDEPRRLYGKTGIYHIIRLVHGLVAIAMQKSVPVEHICLRITVDGSSPIHARLYRRWAENGSATADARAPLSPVPFESIGGINGIVKWINAADRYWLPMIRAGSRWLSPTAYLENKFSDVYVALEAIARIRAGVTSGNNQLKDRVGGMDKALRKLASGWDDGTDEPKRGRPDDGFERLGRVVGDVEGWARAMVRERSRLVIHPGVDSYSQSGEPELRPLFETGYALAVLCLLDGVGIASAAGRAFGGSILKSPATKPPGGEW